MPYLLDRGGPSKEAEAIQYIRERIQKTGRTPTLREVARKLNISTSNAHYVLQKLVERGVVNKANGKFAGYTLKIPKRARFVIIDPDSPKSTAARIHSIMPNGMRELELILEMERLRDRSTGTDSDGTGRDGGR